MKTRGKTKNRGRTIRKKRKGGKKSSCHYTRTPKEVRVRHSALKESLIPHGKKKRELGTTVRKGNENS